MLKVLALLSDTPIPPNTGSRVRNFYLWPALKKLGVDLKILGLNYDTPCARARWQVSHQSVEASLFSFEKRSMPTKVSDVLRYSYHQRPFSKVLQKQILKVIDEWKPNIVHAEELRMAAYLPKLAQIHAKPTQQKNNLKNDPPKTTLTLHNVESDLLRLTGSLAKNLGAFNCLVEAQHLKNLIKFEKQALMHVDQTFTYSETDRIRYQSLYPFTQTLSTQNGVATNEIKEHPQTETSNVLIVGNLAYQPNIEGLSWFTREVLPHLPASFTVTVAGSRAADSLKKYLNSLPQVKFIDGPSDLSPLYCNCSVSVVPLLNGSGTRTKILESLAYGRMVITTPIGAEGLHLKNAVIQERDPIAFAQAIIRWTHNFEQRAHEAKLGRQDVEQHYDWSIPAINLLAIWENLHTQKNIKSNSPL